jgi:predicted NACHT family NTPase
MDYWDEAKLLPMLDGLDELESVHQEPCVRKINEFLQSECHPQYLVVCSRQEEYEKVVRGQWQQDVQQESEEVLSQQDTRLNLNNAIVLKPY